MISFMHRRNLEKGKLRLLGCRAQEIIQKRYGSIGLFVFPYLSGSGQFWGTAVNVNTSSYFFEAEARLIKAGMRSGVGRT